MDPLMPEFLKRLRMFCRAERGRVSALAKFLGVAQPHVSAWLTGQQQPSGEYTLRIQQWMETTPPKTESLPDETPVWLL